MTSLETAVQPILARYGHDPAALLQILRETQEALDWISPQSALFIAEALKIPLTRVESVTQFYAHLYGENRGKFRILFSDNITDRMAGSVALMEHMLKRLKLERGKVSADGLVSVDFTSCTGMCDQGPALLVNNRAITRLTPRRIDEICDLVRAEAPLADWPAHYFHVEDNIRRADMLLGSAFRTGEATRAAIALGPQGVLAEVRKSNLRGRGGAGFTTAVKWEACRNAPGSHRYVVCNADEGEPGTFKDRVLLQSFAERVFEGMAIAGYAIGARQGFLYLRGEYRYLLEPLEAKLARRCAAQNLLGERHLRRRQLPLRHRHPSRRRRLYLRRGNGADRIARRQAGNAAHSSALPRDAWLSRPADRGEQCRDPVQGDRNRRSRAGRPMLATAPSNRPARKSCRCRAIANGRAFTNIRSACACAGAGRLRRARHERRAGQRRFGELPVAAGIRPPHRLRGRAHRRLDHGFRQEPRPVRRRAQFRAILRA